ncbi:glycosyltransferase family 92 protein [Pimephales promelas]|nr:glycosyltransferase family 92 protein [Pimephales promelas]
MEYLPIRNKVARETFKFNFTICISNLFGDYNNALQFAQTIEMYKLLGVQHVVIYKTKCGPDLEKLLKHYETEGILEIVSWAIDTFLNPSSGWNIKKHKGDVHYYGQLVTLNECIYRHMYQSRYVLLNDIDEIIMPYEHTSLTPLMEDLQSAHPNVGVFLIENHIFSKTQFEDSGKFKRAEWKNIPGVNIMEHIYREPDRKNIYNPTKMIVNPRMVQQTSVHSTLKEIGGRYHVPFNVCRIVHVRVPFQRNLTKDQLFVDKRVWDFEQELIPNIDQTLMLSGLLKSAVSRHLSRKSVGRKKCCKKHCSTRRGDRTLRKIMEKDRFQTLGTCGTTGLSLE